MATTSPGANEVNGTILAVLIIRAGQGDGLYFARISPQKTPERRKKGLKIFVDIKIITIFAKRMPGTAPESISQTIN